MQNIFVNIDKQVQSLVQGLHCSRRKRQSADTAGGVACAGDADLSSKVEKPAKVSDVVDLSTEIDDFSDYSGRTDGSTEGYPTATPLSMDSDGEASSDQAPPATKMIRGSARTMRRNAPRMESLGLETQQEHPLPAARFKAMSAMAKPKVRRNPYVAPVDATSASRRKRESQLSTVAADPRKAISSIRDAFDEFEVSLPPSSIPLANTGSPASTSSAGSIGSNIGDDLATLRNLFDKLSPQEAAVVRSMLEKRASSNGTATTNDAAKPANVKDIPIAREINGALAAAAGIMQTARTSPSKNGGHNGPSENKHMDAKIARCSTRYEEVGPRSCRDNVNQTARHELVGESEGSMRTFLRDLTFLDNARVVMVRKVNRLGPDPASKLQDYFTNFGGVERVMASTGKAGQLAKMRPPTVGFVVMDRPEDVEAALSHGSTHVVAGEEVSFHRFQSHSIEG